MENETNSTDQTPGSAIEIPRPYKLAWGITGAGDLITEVFEAMKDLKKNGNFKITAILSKAAVKVIKAYRLWNILPTIADKILVEKDANTPFIVGSLQTRKFDALLVAPTTGNSVAKIAHGIADTLITNAVAMTTRTKTQVFILPVEKEGKEVNTTLPDGSKLELFTRDLDAQNTAKLRKIKGISVLDAPEDIKKLIVSR
ncbi:MAG: archaeoflavoprotein AfpA [Deltaproteobacteria bacterium]|nr:archaeoflavoprotein AfpA [Deltaproteobacteria bacterium]